VNADLQHDPAGHAVSRVPPRAHIDLSEPIAADIGLGIYHTSKHAVVNLLPDPTEMRLAAALIPERQDHACAAAGRGERARIRNGIGYRFVEEHVLARPGGGARRLEVRVVRRGVDDGLDAAVVQHRLVARSNVASVLRREGAPFLLRSRVTRDDLKAAGTGDGVGQHVRPPPQAEATDSDGFRRHQFTFR